MANTKIVIDADNGKIDQAAEKTAQKLRGAAKDAASVGKQIENWAKPLVSSLVKINAIMGVMSAVTREVERQRSASIEGNKKAGGDRLEREKTAIALGLDKGPSGMAGALATMQFAGGGRSQEESDNFFSRFASGKTKNGRPYDRSKLPEATRLFNSQVINEDEIFGRLEKNLPLTDLRGVAQERNSRLSDESFVEMMLRNKTRNAEQEKADKESASGLKSRTGEIARLLRSTRNGGFINGLQEVGFQALGAMSMAGPFLEGGARAVDNAILDNGSAASEMLKELKQIKTSNELMRAGSGPRPNFSTSPEGGP
jgi:hypothetical protein